MSADAIALLDKCSEEPHKQGRVDRGVTKGSTKPGAHRTWPNECEDGKGGEMRRTLPIMDPGPRHEQEPHWLYWLPGFPTQPGFYWAFAPGVWQKVVEIIYAGGQLVVNDAHAKSSKDRRFYTNFAGPIPMPCSPMESAA